MLTSKPIRTSDPVGVGDWVADPSPPSPPHVEAGPGVTPAFSRTRRGGRRRQAEAAAGAVDGGPGWEEDQNLGEQKECGRGGHGRGVEERGRGSALKRRMIHITWSVGLG